MQAAESGDMQTVREMIQSGQDEGMGDALIYAINALKYSDLAIVRMLLEAGANPATMDNHCWTVEDFAWDEPHQFRCDETPLYALPDEHAIHKFFQTLIDAGADTEQRTSGGQTSLMLAVAFARHGGTAREDLVSLIRGTPDYAMKMRTVHDEMLQTLKAYQRDLLMENKRLRRVVSKCSKCSKC